MGQYPIKVCLPGFSENSGKSFRWSIPAWNESVKSTHSLPVDPALEFTAMSTMILYLRYVLSFLSMLFGIALLSGCLTMSGNYIVTAVDAQDKPLKLGFFVQGRHIYTARNGICAAQPGAIVTIRVQETGKELESESPYRCPAR
jgi:hypothetical protein